MTDKHIGFVPLLTYYSGIITCITRAPVLIQLDSQLCVVLSISQCIAACGMCDMINQMYLVTELALLSVVIKLCSPSFLSINCTGAHNGTWKPLYNSPPVCDTKVYIQL